MFHHIVLMRLSGIDAAFHRQVAVYVARIHAELPYVRGYAFVPNRADRAAGYDWAVLSSFDTEEDHDRYQGSAVHREMKAYMASFIEAMVVCDAETRA